ncbi:hypothetical protein SK3146_00181 [Paenibacillus konkukensis]|uniref:Uncharacterized protein n=1 Tax=Paenibacillus konkukensis TaxID=2020716 RepID=A0ABY4RGS4_9BACL|nr:hypothetical protein [Paenibacillus konkukensis]UQZ81025.1 hypothetical protein SK3146_00181 [Paenibacillus konkukensis]
MWIPVEIIKERENPVIMDGIKSLLKESYHISENEANLIMNRASERSEGLIFDYFPYVHSIHELSDGIRNTLDKHLNRVDQEGIIVLKMVNEAAAWHAFECIRRFYKNKANHF